MRRHVEKPVSCSCPGWFVFGKHTFFCQWRWFSSRRGAFCRGLSVYVPALRNNVGFAAAPAAVAAAGKAVSDYW